MTLLMKHVASGGQRASQDPKQFQRRIALDLCPRRHFFTSQKIRSLTDAGTGIIPLEQHPGRHYTASLKGQANVSTIAGQSSPREYELEIVGAPPGQSPPRWYAGVVWLSSIVLFSLVAFLANISCWAAYPAALPLTGGAIVLAVLAFSRLGKGRLVLGPSPAAWALLIILLAALPRLALVLYTPYAPCIDFKVYDDAGRQMAQTWTLDQGGLACYCPPGQVFSLGVIYSAFSGRNFQFLGATINDIKAAQIANVLYATLTVLMLWYIGGQLLGKYVGRVTGLLAALLPSSVFSCMLLGAEAPEALWLTLALAVYLAAVEQRQRLWPALFAGLLLGVGALIRPQFLLLPLPIGLHMLLAWPGKARALSALILLTLGVALAVGPWTYRNYKVTGGLVLISSNNGQVMYSANCHDANGMYNAAASKRLFAAIKAVMDDPQPGQPAQEDLLLQKIGNGWAWQWIAEHPWEFLRLAPDKFRFFWDSDKEIAWWALTQPTIDHPELGISRGVQALAEGGSNGYYAAIVIAVVVALVRFRGALMRRREWMALPLVAWYFTGVHMVFESQNKYHYMLVPLLCIFAAMSAAPAEVKIGSPGGGSGVPAEPPRPPMKEIPLDELVSS